MPWVIENVSGIRTMVRNAGMASSKRSSGNWRTLRNISAPTSTRIGAAAYGGTLAASGPMNRQGTKHSAGEIQFEEDARKIGSAEQTLRRFQKSAEHGRGSYHEHPGEKCKRTLAIEEPDGNRSAKKRQAGVLTEWAKLYEGHGIGHDD